MRRAGRQQLASPGEVPDRPNGCGAILTKLGDQDFGNPRVSRLSGPTEHEIVGSTAIYSVGCDVEPEVRDLIQRFTHGHRAESGMMMVDPGGVDHAALFGRGLRPFRCRRPEAPP
jgi:hypothetical protein